MSLTSPHDSPVYGTSKQYRVKRYEEFDIIQDLPTAGCPHSVGIIQIQLELCMLLVAYGIQILVKLQLFQAPCFFCDQD